MYGQCIAINHDKNPVISLGFSRHQKRCLLGGCPCDLISYGRELVINWKYHDLVTRAGYSLGRTLYLSSHNSFEKPFLPLLYSATIYINWNFILVAHSSAYKRKFYRVKRCFGHGVGCRISCSMYIDDSLQLHVLLNTIKSKNSECAHNKNDSSK